MQRHVLAGFTMCRITISKPSQKWCVYYIYTHHVYPFLGWLKAVYNKFLKRSRLEVYAPVVHRRMVQDETNNI